MALAMGPASARTPAYPARPVTLVVPATAGGGADLMARAFAVELSRRLAQPVVVENAPGASGAIAARKVLRARADGHTLLVGVTSDLVTTALAADAGYTHHDFTAIAKLGGSPMALVAKARGLPLGRLIERARKTPCSVSIGFGGSTGLGAYALADLMDMSGIVFLPVPYQGAAPTVNGLLGGQVDLALLPLSAAWPHARAGRVSLVAVLSRSRVALAQHVPTMAEAGFVRDLDVEIWAVLVGPRGLAPDVVETLNAAVQAILQDRDFVRRRSAMGENAAEPMSAAAVAEFLDAERERYLRLAGRVVAPR